jgi:DNA-directed RNA polymerase subunit M/transcription elongation factor TFIIS
MTILSTVLLSIKGEVRKANLQLDENNELNSEILQKYFKKKEVPEIICHYEHDNKIIFIFGYKKGKKGTENKTELPEPHVGTVLYGDAIAILSLTHKWNNPIHFTVDQWNSFVDIDAKDDSDDENSEDSEDEEENDIISDEEGKSVKDDFEENEVEHNSIVEEEEELDDVPRQAKKKRIQIYNKVDATSIKEEISLNSEPESIKLRSACLNSLNFLENKFSKDDIRLLEKAIFEAAYNYAKKHYIARSWKSPIFIEIYRQIIRSVLSNIHPDSPVKNPRLLNRVIDGEFKLNEIPSMSAYDMYPEKWFSLKDKLLQREQKILEGNKSRATDQFKCRRCHKRECTYYELQTRSADEPMTIFITCLNCGKEWRQGG